MFKTRDVSAEIRGREGVKIERWEHFGAVLMGVCIVLGMLIITGALDSGYHFVDDHELIRLEYSFRVDGASLWKTALAWIKNDLGWRFRPVYWVERVSLAYFFGGNLLYWNIYTAVQGILACYLLYFTARYTGNKRMISILFTVIIILGPQFQPWYRSANQENTGLLFCAFVVWLTAFQHHAKKERKHWLNALIVVSAVICGLIKESFTLFMPVFVMLKIWLEYCGGDISCTAEGGNTRGLLARCVKDNLFVAAGIFTAMLANICCILFVVGVDKVSYAGFRKELALIEYVRGLGESLFGDLDWYTYMGVLFVILAVMCYRLIDRSTVRQGAGFLAIGVYIMAVQLIAHASSRMWGRYMIPYILGWALVFVLLGYRLFERDRVQRSVYTALLLFLLLCEAPKAYLGAKDWAYDGGQVRLFLQCVTDNVTRDDQLVGAFTAEELNLAVASWLEAHGYIRMYNYDSSAGTLTDILQFAAVNQEPGEWREVRAAVCYSWSVGLIVEKMGLVSEEGYRVFTYGDYSVILKNL